jgi:hypothetical protein
VEKKLIHIPAFLCRNFPQPENFLILGGLRCGILLLEDYFSQNYTTSHQKRSLRTQKNGDVHSLTAEKYGFVKPYFISERDSQFSSIAENP